MLRPVSPLLGALALVAPAFALLSAQTPAAAPELPSAAFRQSIDALTNKHEFTPKFPKESRWLDGGERYTILEPSSSEPSAADPRQIDLVAYNTATGARSVLVPAAKFTPAGAREPLDVESYAWSPDKQHLLLFTNSKKVWRDNTRGDFWVLDLASSRLTQLGGHAPASSLMFAKFSPDSRSVAYVRENNLYAEDLDRHKVRQLTSDGSPDIINGTTDWVTEEELSLRDAFRWSPDSQSILFWHFDQTGVGDFTLINDTAELYPVTFHYKYPQPGTTNSAVTLGVLPAKGGKPRWIKLPGDPRNIYIPRADWIGDSDEITVEQLNRLQNDDKTWIANGRSGDVRLLVEDKEADFIDTEGFLRTVPHFVWLPEAPAGQPAPPKQDLLFLSERDGWRHAYLVSRVTGQLRLITNFPADVIEPVSVDTAGGYLYFLASPTDPIRDFLYRARLDGSGAPERVTPATDSGRNLDDISPDGKWSIHEHMSATEAPRFDLVSLPTYKVVRTLQANPELEAKVQALGVPAKEFSETSISGAVTLNTFLIKPPNFDPAKKYPVLTYVYGEPAAQTVLDSYGDGDIFLSLLAREGYLILSFDTAGTPSPRGRAWRRGGYGAIGILSSQQGAEAIQAFAQAHPFVDTSRMAIWGWSGGGTSTLNMMFRHPGVYTTGIAVAAVADQAHYDSIYQERYMGTPQSNPRGYHDAAAINAAEGLTGNLLLIHGSGDDNVHFQCDELLVNRLIALGKTFDFMDYPNRTHAIIEGPGTRYHLYNLIARYLETHVPPGPQPR